MFETPSFPNENDLQLGEINCLSLSLSFGKNQLPKACEWPVRKLAGSPTRKCGGSITNHPNQGNQFRIHTFFLGLGSF